MDAVDLTAATERGVLVANVPGGNSVAVAEHALALIFHMAKRIPECPRFVAQRVSGAPAGIELSGKTVAIVGLGASGRELARRARALGMNVTAVKARPQEAPDVPVDFLGGPGDLSQVLRDADFVSLHLPLTEATRACINQDVLDHMKPSAYLINVARAALVSYDALYKALCARRIAGAAFDVFWSEPPDPADAILRLESFVLTPHVAGFSDVSIRTVCATSRGQNRAHQDE